MSFSCLLKAKKEYLFCSSLVCTLMVTSSFLSSVLIFVFLKCGCYRACVIVNMDSV